MTYCEVVEAVARSVLDEEEALALACCSDLLELCEMAAGEKKGGGLFHDARMTMGFSKNAVPRRRLH
ncbi:hypothetical protein ASG43_11700 [Aureimonas sp. Leaf454]|uniref:hypothetical protein n=1 Tax=Aureimonas sp. Leaf454 TaxID=1736381 RepID=UPI0007019C73|nr:hypothetical protein [Aureimonas sp. Leaf454]KQT46287.1 hypothetical protein ASG43_11700 [Aureimonas sp. Leaf454]